MEIIFIEFLYSTIYKHANLSAIASTHLSFKWNISCFIHTNNNKCDTFLSINYDLGIFFFGILHVTNNWFRIYGMFCVQV